MPSCPTFSIAFCIPQFFVVFFFLFWHQKGTLSFSLCFFSFSFFSTRICFSLFVSLSLFFPSSFIGLRDEDQVPRFSLSTFSSFNPVSDSSSEFLLPKVRSFPRLISRVPSLPLSIQSYPSFPFRDTPSPLRTIVPPSFNLLPPGVTLIDSPVLLLALFLSPFLSFLCSSLSFFLSILSCYLSFSLFSSRFHCFHSFVGLHRSTYTTPFLSLACWLYFFLRALLSFSLSITLSLCYSTFRCWFVF